MYYHYTNIDALHSIITKRKVWFSSMAFMNDEMEGFDLHQVLSEILRSKYKNDECNGLLELIETTIDTFLRFQMIFSASSLKDDISQWRAYSNIGQGVCIEFENGFIEPRKAKKIECLYSNEDKVNSIVNYEAYNPDIDINLSEISSSKKDLDNYIALIIDTLPQFKNNSFSPEKETRWLIGFNGLSDKKENILYRPHRLGLVPYVEIGVNTDKIKSITIGPQVPTQNLKSIEDFILKNNCNGFVTRSNVTLR